ncbi:MAG: flagellar hook-basal body complex protein [Candidatus Tectomicrobia bacterium]|uniref:Flagellar hook protein FlgE n=1 Tax=Tectimicrobiota bacterium TaxID=2528274 RepID=A0A932I3X5_UNCTE|nr:flagellar hook-basal body complex protein [Candidatus Tectomicrobia bacterium]
MSVFPGLSIGASSMENAANALQIVGNNLANLSTSGFKRSRGVQSTAFSSLLTGGSPGNQIGHGALGIQSQRITSQGANERTGIDTDVAVDGNGWFIVKAPASTELLYTRAGNFRLDENRFLVEPDGKRVQGFAVTNGVTGNALGDIAVTSLSSLGAPTTLVQLKGNLNSSASVLGVPPAFTSAAKMDEFTVVQGVNDQIVFEMNQNGTAITASLVTDGGLVSGAPATGAALAAALKQALETQNGTGDTYGVAYDQATDLFSITNLQSNTNTIAFRHGDAASTASALLGFAASNSEPIAPNSREESDLGVAFNVVAGVNDTLSVLIDGAATSVTIAADNYTGQELAFAMEAALRAASAQNVGIQVTYSVGNAFNQFVIKGPVTGGAHTINQPSNTANPSISVAAAQISVTGGTLAQTTGLAAGTAADGTGFFDIADPFATSSSSTVVQIVDRLGNQHPLTIFIRKIGDNAWDWHAALKGESLTGPTPDGFFEQVASGRVRFDTLGKLLSETITPGAGVFNFGAVSGGAVPAPNQLITFDFGDAIQAGGTGLAGISQYESSILPASQGGRGANVLTLTTVISDGEPGGSFTGFRIGDDGFIRVDFSNGRDEAIALLPLALFPAEDELTAISNNLFRRTDAAGTAVVTAPLVNGAGRLLARSLERSNVESAEQFGEMIFQQQIFQANSRVITAANDVLESLINIV